DPGIIGTAVAPFSVDGGLKLLTGNLGRAVIKTSAVKPEHRVVEAPAVVFDAQEDLMAAFDRGELQRDFVAVVRWQGPRANGVPEAKVDAAEWGRRAAGPHGLEAHRHGLGRELFAAFRAHALGAEQGAITFAAAESPGLAPPGRGAVLHERHAFAPEGTA